MPRFFLPGEPFTGAFVELTGEQLAHARVLRLHEGDAVTLCDGNGTDCRCTVSEVGSSSMLLRIDECRPSESEPAVFCTVYMAFPKADKLEHVIQKATELGASEIVVFPSARCVSRPDDKSVLKKLERWNKIAASAAEQSGRGRIPVVRAVGSYEKALSEAAKADLPILFYENEENFVLHDALMRGTFRTAALMTGPEGGFEESEIRQAKDAGLLICSLGKRILRCETAPLCALSALMYASGEF